jgi:hypothetical protein
MRTSHTRCANHPLGRNQLRDLGTDEVQYKRIWTIKLSCSLYSPGLVGAAKEPSSIKGPAFLRRPKNRYHLRKNSASYALSERGHITLKCPGLPGTGGR